MRLIDADRLLEQKRIEKYYHLKNGDVAIPLIDIKHAPTVEERKKGQWIEKHHAYFGEEKAIEEWQSCKCSVCGRYDTKPYMYYFNEPHFCSWCGADMKGGSDGQKD